MGIDWDIIKVTSGLAAMGAAMTFAAFSIFRYVTDDIANERKIFVRRSLCAFLIHPIPAIIATRSGSLWYSIGGDQLALTVVLLGALTSAIALLSNIYFGLRSGVSAGRRAAMAGLCVVVGIATGICDSFLDMFSKVIS